MVQYRFPILDENGKIDHEVIPEDVLRQWGPLTIGTVTVGDTAAATITGQVPDQVLNLVLPKGEPGIDGTTLSRMDFVIPGELQVGFSAAVMMPEGAGWIRRVTAAVGVRAPYAGLIVDVFAAEQPSALAGPIMWASVFPSTSQRINFGESSSLYPMLARDARDYARTAISPTNGWPASTMFRIGISRVYEAEPGEDLTVSIFWERS